MNMIAAFIQPLNKIWKPSARHRLASKIGKGLISKKPSHLIHGRIHTFTFLRESEIQITICIRWGRTKKKEVKMISVTGRQGFSLVELLIVASTLGLVSLLNWPSLRGYARSLNGHSE